MKASKLLSTALTAGTLGAALLSSAPASAAIPIPTYPAFTSEDQTVGVGNFFPESWLVTYNQNVIVTDWAVPGDNYWVYDNGALVGTTNAADCTADGPDGCTIGGSKYANDGLAGWMSPLFAHLQFGAKAGDLITIEVKTIPTGFSDSTVALSSVPEPATWAMMLLGFAGLGFAGYRVRARTELPA
jgi:hypothetical protein